MVSKHITLHYLLTMLVINDHLHLKLLCVRYELIFLNKVFVIKKLLINNFV